MAGWQGSELRQEGNSLGPISVEEYGLSPPLSEAEWRALQAAAEVRQRLGLTLVLDDQASQERGSPVFRVRAGSIVGVARVEWEGQSFSVHVRPKIHGADFLTMFDYAYWADRTIEPLRLEDPVSLAPLAGNVTGLVIRFFLHRLGEFIRRHLRRDYIVRREDLNGRVRGKVLAQDYLRRSLPHRKDYIVPCQFSELSRDTLSNRILLWTLHLCARAVATFPQEQRRLLLPLINARRQALGGVTLTPIRLSDFGRVRYTGLHAAYRPIHALCRFICRSFQMENEAGTAEFREFTLDMNDLFERFVRGVLRIHVGHRFVADKRDLVRSYDLGSGAGEKWIELDGLVKDEDGKPCCVVECKYREVWEPIEGEDTLTVAGGRIRSSDVYQTIAYATHKDLQASAVVLVYPVVGGDARVVGPIEAFGLRPGCDEPVTVSLVGVEIGERMRESLRDFVRQVEAISHRGG